jgi:hypothetical protein
MLGENPDVQQSEYITFVQFLSKGHVQMKEKIICAFIFKTASQPFFKPTPRKISYFESNVSVFVFIPTHIKTSFYPLP